MQFDAERPTITDIYQRGRELKWSPSKDGDVYYFWSQAVPVDVSFTTDPVVVDCEHGNTLEVFSTPQNIELLYRLKISKKPNRFMCKPFDHAIFYTYGNDGGPSKIIKYIYKDKHLSMNKWVDKESYLSVIKTNHFADYESAFWSR
jgi:hypothetical protein